MGFRVSGCKPKEKAGIITNIYVDILRYTTMSKNWPLVSWFRVLGLGLESANGYYHYGLLL